MRGTDGTDVIYPLPPFPWVIEICFEAISQAIGFYMKQQQLVHGQPRRCQVVLCIWLTRSASWKLY